MAEIKFPTEEIELPSKGLVYPEDNPLSSGKIEMKYMTAKEEDILTNQNYIKKGIVLDKLLKSLIVSDINYDDLVVGDKNAILIAALILGYGAEYIFEHNKIEHTVNLTEVNDKQFDKSLMSEGKNQFHFTLPTSKTEITFKFLTHRDENAIANEIKGLKRINKQSSKDLSTRMKHLITSVNGNSEKKTIREFVDNQLLAIDSRALRNYVIEIQPDVDLHFEYEDKNGDFVNVPIPIGINFFWPDAEI